MTKKNKPIDWRIAIVALVILGIIQLGAFYFNIDGTFRAVVAGLIAGIVGLTIENPFKK